MSEEKKVEVCTSCGVVKSNEVVQTAHDFNGTCHFCGCKYSTPKIRFVYLEDSRSFGVPIHKVFLLGTKTCKHCGQVLGPVCHLDCSIKVQWPSRECS